MATPTMRSVLHTTSTTHRRRSATLRALTAVALAGAVLVALVGPASGAPDEVASAEARLAEATAAREQAEQRVRELRARHDELREELQRLGDVDATLTAELADARRALREYAVAAYIDGGRSEVFRATLDIEQAQALAWQADLLAGQSTSAEDTAARFQELKDANSPEQLEVAESLDRAARELQEAEYDAIQAAGFERDAESAVATARAEAAQAALDRAAAEEDAARDAAANRAASSSSASPSASSPSPSPSSASPAAPAPVATPGPQSPAGRGDPSPAERETLARIRWCESRNNYAIVSASGRYRGAYQFDVATWKGVGGSGDPAAASPAEQDYRALLLLRMRGTRPWPHCGR